MGPVLSGQPVLKCHHSAIPHGWLLNNGSTVHWFLKLKSVKCIFYNQKKHLDLKPTAALLGYIFDDDNTDIKVQPRK